MDTFDTLKKLDEDVIPHIDQADLTKEIEDSSKVKDELFAALARVDHALMSRLPSVPSTVSTPTVTTHAVMAKLPKLSLSIFMVLLQGRAPFGTPTRRLFINLAC